MKKIALFLAVGLMLAAACSKPPEAPRNELYDSGPGSDSIKMFFDSYAKGDWAALRTVYHDTAAVYHNASGKMSADSIVSFHKARRDQLYDKVETEIYAAVVMKYVSDGSSWRTAWATLNLTMKGTGEVVKLPMNIAWQMSGDKVIGEHAFYNSDIVIQAAIRARQAATPKK